MISQKLLDKTIQYYNKHLQKDFVVKPSLPILYFGNLKEYKNSKLKVITVGKNPSFNEFKLKRNDDYSFIRFPKWDPNKSNLIESLNSYFENNPLTQWFSSFESILNGMDSTYYYGKKNFHNVALHTDICSPIATEPTWSRLKQNEKNALFKEGFAIWKELILELEPDFLLVSVPLSLLVKIVDKPEEKNVLISFHNKKDKTKRHKVYKVKIFSYKFSQRKNTKIIFGQAANIPFGTISQSQKKMIGKRCLQKCFFIS